MFWLKEISPRFKTSEDSDYRDLPSVIELAKKKKEGGGNFLLDNLQQELSHIKDDIEGFGHDLKHKVTDVANHVVDGVKTGDWIHDCCPCLKIYL